MVFSTLGLSRGFCSSDKSTRMTRYFVPFYALPTRLSFTLKILGGRESGADSHAAFSPILSCGQTSMGPASHFTLRNHKATRVKVCVSKRRLVIVEWADGRNIQASTRIVIGRS